MQGPLLETRAVRLPDALRSQLPRLYAQENHRDLTVYAKFFPPDSNCNHLDLAISLLEDVDDSLVAASVTRPPGPGQPGQLMVTRVNADGSQPGDCFLLFEYTNTIVTVTDVQVSDFPSAPRSPNVTVEDDPYRGEDTNLSSRLCSTPAPN